MVYIYKKQIGKTAYYYLRLSKRVNGKIVTKDIAYLGNDISEIENKLQNLPQEYKQDIRKGYRNIKKYLENEFFLQKIRKKKLKKDEYLTIDQLEKIESIKEHFNTVFSKLDKKTQEEIYTNFIIDFAYNTTSLEGNTITLKEANRLLKENLTPKDRTLREIYDLQNTKKVFFEILSQKKSINHDLINSIHDNLIENIDERKGYRTHDIRVFKSKFEASPYKYIQTDMNLLLKWYQQYKTKLHPLVLASLFHQKFERIHPFADGNGRTGRILLCYILLQADYPPLIIPKKKRAEYLDSLSKADKTGIESIESSKFKPLVQFVADQLIENYWNDFLI